MECLPRAGIFISTFSRYDVDADPIGQIEYGIVSIRIVQQAA
jgi:hypothetical protein